MFGALHICAGQSECARNARMQANQAYLAEPIDAHLPWLLCRRFALALHLNLSVIVGLRSAAPPFPWFGHY